MGKTWRGIIVINGDGWTFRIHWLINEFKFEEKIEYDVNSGKGMF